MRGAHGIFRFLLDAAARGERGALVTLVDLSGSASRSRGTHMAVSETGASIGGFSGGCVEAAVIAEAQRVIAAGKAERVRYGAGSRYKDIRLPCGGGIDLMFTPDPPLAVLREAVRLLESRRRVRLRIGADGQLAVSPPADAERRDDELVATHEPDLRLLIVGHGAEPLALARQARAFGAAVKVLSPSGDLVAQLQAEGFEAVRLLSPAPSRCLDADPYTAVVFLFHDHDWELELLEQALAQDAFFVGAMGSRRTHAQRRAALAARGVGAADIDRVVGPIGIIGAARDPEMLAISALAQIAARYHALHGESCADASAYPAVAR
jgi:xanthine dehydrogenase accessory factor